MRHNVANYKDHDRSRESIYLFGFGDGRFQLVALHIQIGQLFEQESGRRIKL